MNPKTILAVEDDPLFLLTLKTKLQKEGFEVMGAETGTQAWALLNSGSVPDLILMDLDLPGEWDGVATAQKIQTTFDIPLIFLSSHTEATYLGKTAEVQAFGYVVKNSGFAVLLASLRLGYHLYQTQKQLKVQGEKLKNALAQQEASEAKLKAREQQYRLLAEHTQDVIWTMDFKGYFTYVSPSVEKLRGYTPEEVMKQTVLEALTPESAQKVSQVFHNTLKEVEAGRPIPVVRMELSQPCKDGSIVWTEVTSGGLYDEAGKPMGILGVTRNIQESYGAKKELEFTKTLLDAAFNQSPVPMVLVTAQDLKIRYINQSMASFMGIQRENYINKPFSEIEVPWQDCTPDGAPIPSNELPLPQALQGRTVDRREILMKRMDGSQAWEMAHGTPIFNPAGELIAGMLVIEDVTKEKNSQKALQDSENQFRLLFETATMGIAIHFEGKILRANKVYKQIFGIPQDLDLSTVDPLELVDLQPLNPPEGYNPTRDGVPQSGTFELEGHKISGESFPLAAEVFSIPFEGTKAMVAFVSDLTHRKKMEEALAKTQRLESIGVVAGGIAHDFNNLLGGVFGYLDLAKQFLDPQSKALKYLDSAVQTFERARNLSSQLLTFAKGGAPIKKLSDPAVMLRSCTKLLLSGSNVGVQFDIPKDLWPCLMDENQFGQVTDNIVLNARQAMPQGGNLTIQAENRQMYTRLPGPLKPGPYVVITFSDTGPGIPADILPKIFDPFFSTKKGGSGLGLATSFSIVHKHGGFLEALNPGPGAGAVLRIYLPASPGEVLEFDPIMPGPQTGKGKILLLDDEAIILEIGSGMLETLGYQVTKAHSSHEALEKYSEAQDQGDSFDLLILDLTIPGEKGGVEVLSQIKNLDPQVRAIASSGYSQDPVLANPLEYGFLAGLPKPYSILEMSDVVSRFIRRRSKTN